MSEKKYNLELTEHEILIINLALTNEITNLKRSLTHRGNIHPVYDKIRTFCLDNELFEH